MNSINTSLFKLVALILGLWCLLISTVLRSQNLPNQAVITLTLPYNEQKLQLNYPLFSWSSAVVFSSPNMTYHFKIVEVMPYQTPSVAVLSNPPLYEKELGSATVFQYPIDAPALQNCKRYAWIVRAYDRRFRVVDELSKKSTYTQTIAQSEVFSFQTDCQYAMRVTNASVTQPYMVLSKNLDNYVFPVLYGELNFKYIEDYAVGSATYKIYNWSRDTVLTNLGAPLLLDYGWNYLTVELTEDFVAGEIYQLEVETPKGDIYKAKFEIIE